MTRLVGYNSVSPNLQSLQLLYEAEEERGNEATVKAIQRLYPTKESRSEVKAIWVCLSALTCFKQYVLTADKYDMDDDVIVKEYPCYEDEVNAVELKGLTCIFEDGSDGYLYVERGARF